jgi:thioesterase domain-containing protein
MVPSAFVELAALPRTANGKLDRKALPAFEQKLSLGEHVAPRSELERAIASVWSQVLGVSEPGVHDDFFAVGGHSLLGVRLLARLEREHGVNLPLQALLEAPTIEALAQRVERDRNRNGHSGSKANGAAAFRFLVPIQPRGSRPPLVCVHGAGGNVVNLRFIAEHLGQSRPFYGVQARGVDGVEAPFESIEEMASAYLAELRLLAPQGPYYLCGYCGGGIVAFEMARMLRAAGETVAFLGLIDTYRPDSVRLPRLPWLRHVTASIEGISYLARQTRRGLLRNRDELAQRAALRWHRATNGRVPHELREAWLTEAFFRAARNYRPATFNGDLVAFRAIDANPILTAMPALGWQDFARRVDVIDVPGNHLTIALEPNAAVLGDQLLAQLAAAEARSSR